MPTPKSKKATAKATPAQLLNELPKTEPALMELFVTSIKEMYWAENHLIKALPKMQTAATSPELVAAIGDHLEITKTHVSRIEEIFGLLSKKPQAKKCEAMESLTKEGEQIIEATDDASATRDIGIIMSAQKVEHHEIAAYGAMVKSATALGMKDIAGILTQTLNEEKEADETLTAVAENGIYDNAVAEH